MRGVQAISTLEGFQQRARGKFACFLGDFEEPAISDKVSRRLKVDYQQPVDVAEVRVHESYNPGAMPG